MTATDPDPGPGLVYVYAAVRPGQGLGDTVRVLTGVAGAGVELLESVAEGATGAPAQDDAPAVAFAVSLVPARDFGEEALKERFEDLDWLADVARAHHAVVESLAACTGVLPLRLATVYRDRERARAALTARRDGLDARLALLAGQAEYGVKVYVSEAADDSGEDAVLRPAEDTRQPAGQGSGLSPGKACLRRRRAQHGLRETRQRKAAEVADRIAGVADGFALPRVRHPLQQGPLVAPGLGANVVNDAYLVPDESAEAFAAEVAAVTAEEGIRVEVTGPWAPYSFAMPPEQPSAPRAPRRTEPER
ncbi:GvpL/GvpF family gas vesicle protein [Streptomyces purpureus]|uniref:Gas vesicle protein n=1 Tax=Streptomyces purpureus TaxID=1951 RepID=A0A918GX29_9ACTN|nr:GvpL/GvpF family gas vesicle protein [Streptomyces purpureus]GGT15754.1 gas vesicle protein [Streptomyces purpureus]